MAVKVHLSPPEIMIGATVGVMRQLKNLQNGARDRHGASDASGWQLHVEGCLGEMAVAKELGMFWSGNIGNYKAADVGSLQVRTTHHANGRLIVHDNDKDGDAFVLVIGVNGDYTIHGWLLGREAKKPEFYKDPSGGRPAFFVPQNKLDADLSALSLWHYGTKLE